MKLQRRLCCLLMILLVGTVTAESAITFPKLGVASKNLMGSEVRLLPANIDVWALDWAPDAHALVYAGKIQGELANKMRVWQWSLTPERAPKLLTNTDGMVDNTPKWSPDGAKIIMTRRELGLKNGLGNSSIWIKDVKTGAGGKLTEGPHDKDPSWSPDAKKFVFVRMKGPNCSQLMIYDFNTRQTKLLLELQDELLLSPHWGKDEEIYFVRQKVSVVNVVVESNSHAVTQAGPGSIWQIEPGGANLRAVVSDAYDNRLPALSHNGHYLAYVSTKETTTDGNGKFDRGSLYVMDMQSGKVRFITNKVGLNGSAPVWNPKGDILAFFTFRSIRPAIWIMRVPEKF